MSIDGKRVGSTKQPPTLIAAGPHEIVVASARAGFRATERVTVEPGQVSAIQVAVPEGSLGVDAQPPSDVLVDGTRVGVTPLDPNLLAAGVRTVVVRNAELGERTMKW